MADDDVKAAPAPKAPGPPAAKEIEVKALEPDPVPETAAATKVTDRVARIAPKKAAFDPLMPFRYLFGFAGGTVENGLNGIASGGRNGMWMGLAAGVLLCMGAGFSLPLLLGTALAGSLAGIVLGGVVGALGGGVGGLSREARRDKYADELAQRQALKGRRPVTSHTRIDSRAYEEDRQRRSEINFDRGMQQDRENQRDANTYWRDSETTREQHQNGWSKGF